MATTMRLVIEVNESGLMNISGEVPSPDMAETLLLRALAFMQRELTVGALKAALTGGVVVAKSIPPIPPGGPR